MLVGLISKPRFSQWASSGLPSVPACLGGAWAADVFSQEMVLAMWCCLPHVQVQVRKLRVSWAGG